MLNFPFPSKPAILILGKILSVDEESFFCRIQPDKDNIPILENVPLRVFNLKDDFGFIIIPEVNSPCMVGFIEGLSELPTLFQVQVWQKIIVKSTTKEFSLVIYQNGKIELDTKNDAKANVKGNVDFYVDGNITGEVTGKMILKVHDTIQLGQNGAHKASWGDKWLEKYSAHIHPTPTGPSGVPTPVVQDQEVNSQQVKLD
jgi:hypothetical protein